jgi:hypothetical protein
MTDMSIVVTVAQSAVLLAGIWVILFWLWPAVRLDCFRQQMFEVRDDLFDYAASGKISFGHPAYKLLRQSMNGFIRYGHQVSFFQFIMTWLAWKALEGRNSFKWEREWKSALNSLDAETKKDLRGFYDRAGMHVCKRIILGSPILLVVLALSAVAVIFHAGWKSAGEVLADALSRTASRTVDLRILDEEAARAAA